MGSRTTVQQRTQVVLTAGFGMRPGVSPPLWPSNPKGPAKQDLFILFYLEGRQTKDKPLFPHFIVLTHQEITDPSGLTRVKGLYMNKSQLSPESSSTSPIMPNHHTRSTIPQHHPKAQRNRNDPQSPQHPDKGKGRVRPH